MYAPNQQQNGQPDFMTQVSNWWDSVPFGVKFIFISTLMFYIIDFQFNGYITYILFDYPILTLNGQLWRIFFTEFVHGQLLNLLFGLLSIYAMATRLEQTIGTINFIIDLFLKNILIQIVYLIMIYGLSFLFGPSILEIPSFGLWNLVITYISIRSFSNPNEESQFLCFPIQIQNKYYPFAIIIFVNLFSFPKLDFIAAVLVGYVEYNFFNGMMFRPSKERVERIGNTFLFSRFTNRQDFIQYDGQLAGQNQQSYQVRAANDPNSNQQQQQQQQFREFKGKGTQIGSDANKSNQNQVYPTYIQDAPYEYQQESQMVDMQSNEHYQIHQDQEQNQEQSKQQAKQNQGKKQYNALGEDIL